MAQRTKKTIPYYLFKHPKSKKSKRSPEEAEIYAQLASIYANRYFYQQGDKKSPYVYSPTYSKPVEVIKPITTRFIYEYLICHQEAVMTYKGRLITYEEYLAEIDEYDQAVLTFLEAGFPVTLPQFLGIIKITVQKINKYSFVLKSKVPKKIITLDWQNRFLRNRLLNVINPNWLNIRIINKKFLKKLYLELPQKEGIFSVKFGENNLSKKL
jgi:hypothetical protein